MARSRATWRPILVLLLNNRHEASSNVNIKRGSLSFSCGNSLRLSIRLRTAFGRPFKGWLPSSRRYLHRQEPRTYIIEYLEPSTRSVAILPCCTYQERIPHWPSHYISRSSLRLSRSRLPLPPSIFDPGVMHKAI
jgi:hypothetical protein